MESKTRKPLNSRKDLLLLLLETNLLEVSKKWKISVREELIVCTVTESFSRANPNASTLVALSM